MSVGVCFDAKNSWEIIHQSLQINNWNFRFLHIHIYDTRYELSNFITSEFLL